MRRLFTSITILLLALSVGLGSIAAATEQAAGIEISAAKAAALGHQNGDHDEVPGDSAKGYPHHHECCHGDHVGVPVTARAAAHSTVLGPTTLFPPELGHSGLGSDRMLRPPRV